MKKPIKAFKVGKASYASRFKKGSQGIVPVSQYPQGDSRSYCAGKLQITATKGWKLVQLVKKNAASVQPSPSFDSFAKTISGYAKEEYICFELRMFEKYCFKEVHTFTEAEFESYLVSLRKPERIP